MKLRELEAVHEAVELLVEDLQAKSTAAVRRHELLGVPTTRELKKVLQVEAEARRFQGAVGGTDSKGHRRGLLVALVTAAAEFDAEFPRGGALLECEHGESRQMTQTLVAHLVGEFSFGFLACEKAARLRDEARVVLDVICSLHLPDWKKLGVAEAVTA